MEIRRLTRKDLQLLLELYKHLQPDDGKVHALAYEETESYQGTKMFLENRDQMLLHLLEE